MTTKLIIAGQEYESTQRPLEVHYPWDHSTVVGDCHVLDLTHLHGVLGQAQKGYEEFRASSMGDRIDILQTLAQHVEKERETLARLITLESGKPIKLSHVEVDRAVNTLNSYVQFLSQWKDPSLKLPKHAALIKRFPFGPVLAITPFNFPLNLVIHKLAPAIASGTSITIKPASKTPLTALFLGMLTILSGYPYISVVPCYNPVAETLVQSGVFKKISFTGSQSVGWHLHTLSPKAQWTLELGSNSACIVDDFSYGLVNIAERCAQSAFQFAGQSCISLQRLYVQRSRYEEFLTEFAQATQALNVGHPMGEDIDVGPMISPDAVVRVEKWVQDALEHGASPIVGGQVCNSTTFEPTILTKVTPNMKVVDEEIFGPVVSVIPYDNFSEALKWVNRSKYGIHAGVFTGNREKVNLAFSSLEVGGVLHNDTPSTRLDYLPYGGVKESGFGREGAMSGYLDMTYQKTLISPD